MELDGIISKQMEDVTKLSEARDKMIDDCNQLKETVIAKEVGIINLHISWMFHW